MDSKVSKYKYNLEILDYVTGGDSQARCLSRLLEVFHGKNPEFTEWVAARKGRRVRLIAMKPEDLRLNLDRQDLVDSYAIKLRSGWWMYSLWSGDKVLKLMDACTAHMGLKFGVDVRVDLQRWGYPNFVSTAINIEDLL